MSSATSYQVIDYDTGLAFYISLVGWILTDGTTASPLTGVVPAGDVLALTIPTSIETTQVGCLFEWSGGRADQVGFAGTPTLRIEECIGRCLDGGGSNWNINTCTQGESNESVSECGGTTQEAGGWGRLLHGVVPRTSRVVGLEQRPMSLLRSQLR